jgi:type II secretory pathway pseudopilin PulG
MPPQQEQEQQQERQQQRRRERRVLGMPLPVALGILGAALIIGLVWFIRKRQQAASMSGSASAFAQAGEQLPQAIQQNVYTTGEESAVMGWLQQLWAGETALSKQIDALSLQSYSETQYLAAKLGAPLGPPTWRGSPGPTPWPSWILSQPSEGATVGQPSVPNPLGTNIAMPAAQFGGTYPTSPQGVSS